MSVTWSRAPEHILAVARRVIEEHHSRLKTARIGFLMRSEAPYSNARYTYGKARKVSDEQKVHVPFDFVIWLAKDKYMAMRPEQREALIDHELCHCRWNEDTLDASIRPHDVEEFLEVIQRHGYWWPGAYEAAEVMQQAPLFEPDQEGVVESVLVDEAFAEEVADFIADMDGAVGAGNWEISAGKATLSSRGVKSAESS